MMDRIKGLSVLSKSIVSGMAAFSVFCMLLAIFAGGCVSSYSVRVAGFEMKGKSMSPESVMLAKGQLTLMEADAKATSVCADNPAKCRAAEIASGLGWYGAGMDTPHSYTWAGVQATQQANQKQDAPANKQVRSLKKDIAKLAADVKRNNEVQQVLERRALR